MNSTKETAKSKILGYLSHCFAPAKAVNLSNAAGLNETDRTYPVCRSLILDLIKEGHVIGSSSRGYFLMKSGKEVQVYLNSLMKRQIGISNRIQSVYDSAAKGGLL